MSVELIKAKVEELVNQVLLDGLEANLDSNGKLRIILSESIQALSFVSTLEEEFNIEFDDDEIDLNFFLDINIIVERIKCHTINQINNV